MNENRRRAALPWAFVLFSLLTVHVLTTNDSIRMAILRTILLLTALGESVACLSFELHPRHSSERSGRPYEPAYHGVLSDFGFYNLAFALLLGVAALDPPGSRIAVGVVVVSYIAHGTTHLLRHVGLYFGGGHPIPTRPRELELRDGLQLIAPAAGLLLFFPWRA